MTEVKPEAAGSEPAYLVKLTRDQVVEYLITSRKARIPLEERVKALPYNDAREALGLIEGLADQAEELLGVEVYDACEGCGDLILDGEYYAVSEDDGTAFCKVCLDNWQKEQVERVLPEASSSAGEGKSHD